MRNYLFGIATAGVIACQFLDMETPAYYFTVFATITSLLVGLLIRQAR